LTNKKIIKVDVATHSQLKAIGKKSQTFDQIISDLLDGVGPLKQHLGEWMSERPKLARNWNETTLEEFQKFYGELGIWLQKFWIILEGTTYE